MSRAPVSQLPDAAMQGVDAALLRAAQRARDVARRTGTALVIVRDGVLVEERVDDAPAPAPTPVSSRRLVEGARAMLGVDIVSPDPE